MDPVNAQNLKSFWQKPEGKVGAVIAALLAVGGVYAFAKALPFLLILAQNTLHLLLLLGVIGGIAVLVMDPKFRTAVSYLYKTIIRKMTGMIIELDPISILKTYLRQLYDNLQNMNEQIGLLKGQMRKLQSIIEANEKEIKDNLDLAARAQKGGQKNVMVLKTRKAGRMSDSNVTYKKLYTKMEVIYRVLSKMYENCGILYEDTEDQIKQKEVEWNVIRQSHKAIKSAMSVVNGNADQRAIFEQALEFMATDLSNKIGEMERFMDVSKNFMEGIDLQNGVFEEKGLKMLEEWEKNADSFILGDDKSNLINKANDDKEVINLDTEAQAGSYTDHINQYNTLFK